MKKRIIFILAAVYLVAFVLAGCPPQVFETDEYRRMNAVFVSVSGGDTLAKTDIYNKLGYPESYTTAEGETFKLHAGDRTAMWDTLLQSSVTGWGYSCKKHADSEYIAELKIFFNSENKTSSATFG